MLRKLFALLSLAAILTAGIPVANAAAEQSSYKGQNLLPFSEQVDNALWNKTNVTIEANTSTSPIGDMTADALRGNTTNAQHRTYTGTAAVMTLGEKATYSVFAKAGSKNWILLQLNDSIAATQVNCDLTNGVLGTVGTSVIRSSITSVGNGWYRCSGTIVNNIASSLSLSLDMANGNAVDSYAGTAGDTIYVWGAQVEQDRKLGPYNRTLSVGFPNAVPASRVSASQSSSKGQNILTFSEQFDNAIWVNTNVTASADTTIAPDGSKTADTITDSNDGGSTSHYKDNQLTVVNGRMFTVSVYAKAGTKNFIDLSPDAAAIQQNFNLTNCTVASLLNNSLLSFRAAGAQSVGNGWCRVWVTWVSTGFSDNRIWILNSDAGVSYTGNGTGTIFLWGAQHVVGSKPAEYNRVTSSSFNASYIPAGAKQSSLKGSNGIKFSEQFDNAAWVKLNLSVATDTALGADGLMDAEVLTDNAINGTHSFAQNQPTGANGKIVTWSIYLKKGTNQWIGIFGNGGGAGRYFDLVNGVIGTGGGGANLRNARITPLPGGWYRCEVTFLSDGSTVTLYMASADGVVTYVGTGSTVTVWGGQLEAGNRSGAYNRTTSNTVNP